MEKQRRSRAKKGALAAGAALLLTTGAGGTFAYWQVQAGDESAAITAGEMKAELSGGAWYDCRDQAAGQVGLTGCDTTAIDIATFRIVPGDKVKYSGTITTTMVGDNLKADFAVNAFTTSGELIDAPGSHITVNSSIVANTPSSAPTTGLTEAEDGATYDLLTTVEMPWAVGGNPPVLTNAKDEGNGKDGMTETAKLTGLSVTLTQVQ